MTVDSVNIADGDGREVNLEDNYYDEEAETTNLWFVSDVGGCGDGIEEIVGHRLEYSIECQGSQTDEDNPPHGCPGLGLSLGGIADTCQSVNKVSTSVSPISSE